MTFINHDGDLFTIYPVCWCPWCEADRPHHGPYCMTCGTDKDTA